MPKRVLTGRVKSDKMSKTRVVEIARLVRHPKYRKFYRDRTTCYVHDEEQRIGRRRHGANCRIATHVKKETLELGESYREKQ